MKYGELTLGHVEAVVNKLGGMEGVQKFLSGELTVSETNFLWNENEGVVRLLVTSDGTTGEEWIGRLRDNGVPVDPDTKSILSSPDFTPTNGVTTEVVILKALPFSDKERNIKMIRGEAQRLELLRPNAEVACLIQEMFLDGTLDTMSLQRFIIMHEPIKSSDGTPRLLSVDRSGWMKAFADHNLYSWPDKYGFAFAAPQIE